MSRATAIRCRIAILPLVACLTATVFGADRGAYRHAIQSITAAELKAHVAYLADDRLEGREAGSRGGRAAGAYLLRYFRQHQLRPAGEDGGYIQPFGYGYRNLLGLIQGRDPQLSSQVILVGAHYDHVGYGSRRNSYGPIGYIHNGADDNASGTAAVLETIEAFGQLAEPPRRSVLFALWDGEEKGLLGSKHWISQPTVSLDRVKFLVNVDMIGRLRRRRLEVGGTRTSLGLRRLVSLENRDIGLDLDFPWQLKNHSDHYPFFTHNVPVLMLHTGLHEDYHRPTDDADKVNVAGMQDVVRMLFRIAYDLAQQPQIHGFRSASRWESAEARKRFEAPQPPRPLRLGVWFSGAGAGQDGLLLTGIRPGSPAARAGLRVGDRIVRFAGLAVEDGQQFLATVLRTVGPAELTIRRAGAAEPLAVTVELAGRPVRLGISWREDDAEPGTAMISRVVPGSPAQRAGLHIRDRLYSVNGRPFQSSAELLERFRTLPGPLDLLVERHGRLRNVKLDVPEVQLDASGAAP